MTVLGSNEVRGGSSRRAGRTRGRPARRQNIWLRRVAGLLLGSLLLGMLIGFALPRPGWPG